MAAEIVRGDGAFGRAGLGRHGRLTLRRGQECENCQ